VRRMAGRAYRSCATVRRTVDDDAVPLPALSPWRTIWLSPRATIRRLVDAEVRPSWVPVVALAALHQAVMSLQVDPTDGTLSFARSAMPVVIAVLQLLFGVLVGPFLLAFVGGWLGGDADPADIRQSVAWSNVPYAVATVCWIPILAAFGGQAFREDLAAESPLQWIALPMFLAIGAAALWSFVLQVITLAEVQRFSNARALASILILVIPLLLLGALS
jgi:hypothetical protein